MPSPAQLHVDLNALAHNFHALEAVAGVPVHPVVKADAYGLGIVPVARRLMREGARTFFVARCAEGETLREALGPTPEIYVLDGCLDGRTERLLAGDLRPVLNDAEQLARWPADVACGLQIDTGMNRLGFRLEDAPAPFPGVRLVLSHLACADAPAAPMNARQRDAFEAVARLYPGTVRSFANSGGAFLKADYGFDGVRPGISLFGGGPEGRPDAGLKTVATFTAEVLQVRDVPAGESVGYAATYRAETPRRIATCGAGYADGVLRSSSPRGQVFVAGELRPMVGRVSMDVLAVDVTGLDVRAGDRVELFGPNRPIEDAAEAAGAIAYELLTAINRRVERMYTGAQAV